MLSITPFDSQASLKRYFALQTTQGTVVGSYLDNPSENNRFVEIAEHLRKSGIRTPEIYFNDEQFIIQEYLGQYNAVEWFDRESVHLSSSKSSELLRGVMNGVIVLAADMHAGIALDNLVLESFIETTAIRDCELFMKYWDDESVRDELLDILDQLKSVPNEWIRFCHRDYQLRNIMANHGNPKELVVIDFQSALQGPITYNLASLLFSSRYSFNEEEEIYEFLIQAINARYW